MALLDGRSIECAIKDCHRSFISKGLCREHYMEQWRGKLLQESCIVEDCDRPRGTAVGYCVRCDQRIRQYGSPTAGPPRRRKRGTGPWGWYFDEQRRAAKAKMSQVTGETAQYVKIIRKDPCVYCGHPSEQIDHIFPFADGGETNLDNLAPACAKCNHKKHRRSLLEFLMLQPLGSQPSHQEVQIQT